MNENVSTETGFTPFELTFGPNTSDWFRFLTPGPAYNASKFLKLLGHLLAELRFASFKFSSAIKNKRQANTPAHTQNILQPGDWVLEKNNPPSDKLGALFCGPFQVILHRENTNDVELRNPITDEQPVRPITNLKIFIGDDQQAIAAARLAGKVTPTNELLSLLRYYLLTTP